MSHASDLVEAILRDACASPEEAVQLLDAALERETEPLDYFAQRFGLSKDIIYDRAAGWLGLAFSPVVPQTDSGPPRYDRLDSLAEVRTFRMKLYDREVSYSAPTFEGMLMIRERIDDYPVEIRQRMCIVPDHALRAGLAAASEPLLLDEARQRLARRWPYASAHLDLPWRLRLIFVLSLFVLAVVAAAAPLISRPILLPVLLILLIPPALLRIAAIIVPQQTIDVPPLSDADLPRYSVLIPLRDEANMVPLLGRAMRALDYPPDKLEIKFVVEATSPDTITAVKTLLDDPRFELVVVPNADPHTKPKALNYALPLVRGRHLVIYDAEDIPEPRQLRDAAERFAADSSVDCLQAVIDIDNDSETWLTALYAGEYAGLFRFFLPLLGRWRLPMPLGGTSNHFRTSALREVGGWDAFNVTEDADLGVRLARLRYRTSTLTSRTGEEAPNDFENWLAQRTRWMKGWMQTFVVHNRGPRRFLADIGWRGFLTFEIYVGGLIISPLLHTVFMLTLIAGWSAGHGIRDIWDAAYILILFVGYGAAFAITVAGLIRAGKPLLIAYQLILPFYWTLHAIATVRASVELLTRPYFWAKTAHGRTRVKR